MQFSQKYTIIQLLESVPEGTEFSTTNWPLHVTLVDVFAIDWDVATIADQLTNLLRQYKPFISTTAGETFFGPHQETQVTLVQKTPELATLHYALIALLGQGNLRLNDPQFAQDGFLPHATVQSHARLNVGDTVPFTALSIIDMFPGGDPYKRRILKTISMVS